MYRITKMSGRYYALKLDGEEFAEDVLNEIAEFTVQGIPCLLCEDVDDLEEWGILPDEVTIVERD